MLKEIAEIAQALATAAAILVGGIWTYLLFVKRRQRYPRAEIKHIVTHKQIGNDKLLLHVCVVISNTGDVLVSLENGETRIQQLLPPSGELLNDINKGVKLHKEGETEISWPEIASIPKNWKRGTFEIEPGERDEIHYDFILNADVQCVEVYSYFRNFVKRGRNIGWNVTTIYDISKRSDN